jgi:cytochrome c oxidase subunit IV
MSHNAHQTHSPAAGHGHHGHDVKKEVRKYLLVFGALIIGTIVTVLASYVHFGSDTMNIIVALIIATVKGALVACFFMHLIDERKLIYAFLGATVFFCIALMYITIWSMEPNSLIHFKP